ncbi:MAG: Wzz/FepE/Etk N-terminal domain-containing protein, partial [Thermoflexus sp.]|nr:Wzz/FepE/Etk N-terminal domain-containing protein [Thermoflexus sp.]
MADELTIDLRRYLNVMIRRRRLIIFVAFLSLVAAGLGRLLSPPPYEAVAGVAIVKFPISYEAVAGVEAVQAQAELPSVQPQVKPESFRQLLRGLVPNPVIAQAVISRLKDRLRSEDSDPSRLMEKVEGDIFKSGPDHGDLIFIKVRDRDSVYAAEIANAWAEEYERYINRIYEGGLGESQERAMSELENARREYESAQRAL